MTTRGKTRVTVEVPDKMFEEFKIACIEDKKDMSKILRTAIKNYINNRKREHIVT